MMIVRLSGHPLVQDSLSVCAIEDAPRDIEIDHAHVCDGD